MSKCPHQRKKTRPGRENTHLVKKRQCLRQACLRHFQRTRDTFPGELSSCPGSPTPTKGSDCTSPWTLAAFQLPSPLRSAPRQPLGASWEVSLAERDREKRANKRRNLHNIKRRHKNRQIEKVTKSPTGSPKIGVKTSSQNR